MTAHVQHMSSTTPGPLAFLWEDAETTGLSASSDLLEISVIATDMDLNEISSLTTLVRPTADTFAQLEGGDEIVWQMHERNGLIADLRAHGRDAPTEAEVEESLIGMIEQYGDPDAAPVRLAGGGVSHFDFPYLQHRMPGFTRRLHYRPMDITQVAQAYTAATGTTLFGEKKNKAHRAEDDIREDLDRARAFWELFRAIDGKQAAQHPALDGRESVLAGVEIIRAFGAAGGGDATGSTADLRTLIGSTRESDALAGVTAVASHLAALLARQSGISVDAVLNGARRSVGGRRPQNVHAPRM